MKYDFDTPVNRRNTDSLKWDVAENELPMWVADMDFKTAPEITEAIIKRAEHGIFGYTIVPDEWADAYINWWDKRHGLKMERDWLMFCTGVVPAISSVVRKLTTPAEKVVVQTPCYNIFFNSIYNNGRNIYPSPLKYDGLNYSIDFADLEEKLASTADYAHDTVQSAEPRRKDMGQGNSREDRRACGKASRYGAVRRGG